VPPPAFTVTAAEATPVAGGVQLKITGTGLSTDDQVVLLYGSDKLNPDPPSSVPKISGFAGGGASLEIVLGGVTLKNLQGGRLGYFRKAEDKWSDPGVELTIKKLPAAKLAVKVQPPTSTVAGAAMEAFTVEVQDEFGNGK